MPGLSLTMLNDRSAVQMSGNAPPEGAEFGEGTYLTRRIVNEVEFVRAQFNESVGSTDIFMRIEASKDWQEVAWGSETWVTIVQNFYAGSIAYAPNISNWERLSDDYMYKDIMIRAMIGSNSGAIKPKLNYIEVTFRG